MLSTFAVILRSGRVLSVTTLLFIIAVTPAASQQGDPVAIQKRFNELYAAGNYPAALVEAQKLEAGFKARFGVNHVSYAIALASLADVYWRQGKYAEAEALYKRAVVIREKVLGKDHSGVADYLNNLGLILNDQGKYAEAEGLYNRALAIYDKAQNTRQPLVARTLSNLAGVYTHQGKYSEAEALYKRALEIKEKALGADQLSVAMTLNNLAVVYQGQHKYADAARLYERALAIKEKALGTDHVALAYSLVGLAQVYAEQGKSADAEGLYKRGRAIREKALGTDHPAVADILSSLANLYDKQGKQADAEALYERALAIKAKALGANHPDVARNLGDLAVHFAQTGHSEEALAYMRKATASVIAHAATETASARQDDGMGSLVEQRTNYFLHHLAYLDALVQGGIEPSAAVMPEAFEMMQWADQSSAGAAIQQMGLRFAAGTDALSALVRERQDLSALWRDRDNALLGAVSKAGGQRNQVVIDNIRKQIAETESKLAANKVQLEREFPDYAALANPKPLKPRDVQQLLDGDEALVFWLAGYNHWETYVFALTRDSFQLKTIPLKTEALEQKVAAFRRGLDVDVLLRRDWRGLFDLALAYELYDALIDPVEPLIRDKRHLMVVPTGALTALPFHLLVTEKPTVPVPPIKTVRDLAAYRDAAWLLKRHAVSVLPSVASLKALRVFGSKGQAAKPLVGFGDPIFNPENQPDAKEKITVASRSYPEFWKGLEIDRGMLRGLPRLPETADELKAVAAKLGASTSDIHLQKDASETSVKRARLAEYNVVYFATHGLVAGDVKGLGEPALALSIPKLQSELDDGLLTASEVAQLKLNADWVVLSACNTAAGDKPGAEALSGLARAFFYAGARALLVSHWAVESKAATTLTTSTFDLIKSDLKLGRAEALRRAMLAYMNDATDPLSAYPALWAPFVVVGEGAAR
jgi:CHAT domain-containing protein/tetratricopeptide (TPR) repeat protein